MIKASIQQVSDRSSGRIDPYRLARVMVVDVYGATNSPSGRVGGEQRDLRHAIVSVANDLKADAGATPSRRHLAIDRSALESLSRRIDRCEQAGALSRDAAKRLRALQNNLEISLDD